MIETCKRCGKEKGKFESFFNGICTKCVISQGTSTKSTELLNRPETKGQELDKLKEKLEWLEDTSVFLGSDGLPSIRKVLLILITGIVPGLLVIYGVRSYDKYMVRKKIQNLE